MKTYNVFFIQNLHGIAHFLSLYESKASNLLVLSDNEALCSMIQNILPDERKIVVPSIKETERIQYFYKSVFTRFKVIWLFTYYRLFYRSQFKDVSASAKVYFFSNATIHFAILVNFLKKRGVEINAVDMFEGFSVIKKDEISGHIIGKLIKNIDLSLLRITSGIKLEWFHHFAKKKIKMLGWKHEFTPIPHNHDSWSNLKNKFDWNYKTSTKQAVLLIDAPFQALGGIDIKESQKNIVKHFSNLLNKNFEIHVKPHPQRPNQHSFVGTKIQDRIKIVDPFVPSEIIMQFYKVVFLFASHSGRTPIEGTKYSLAKLLIFKTDEQKKVFWKGIDFSFGDEKSKIEFIQSD